MDKIWIKINEFYIVFYQFLASVNLIHFEREKKRLLYDIKIREHSLPFNRLLWLVVGKNKKQMSS